MKGNQLNKGQARRLLYVENKEGLIDGAPARVGWVAFSKTGRTLYYRGRSLLALGGRGVRGNFMDEATGEEYWVSGVKRRGSNAHPAQALRPVVDEDAREAYAQAREEPA
jgi:hypothetical protein